MALGLAAGFLGAVLSIVPGVLEVEESVGLSWLYGLRPRVEPPESVLIVGISSESADQLGLSGDLDEWPRILHARVVGRLAEAGAAAIVFDLAFVEPGIEEHDEALAQSIASAGNVILLEFQRDRDIDVPGLGPAHRLERIPLVPILDEAAFATAPLLLPRFPIRTSQFWLFDSGTSEIPTVPTVALQTFLVDRYETLLGLLESVAPGSTAGLPATRTDLAQASNLDVVIRRVRRIFLLNPELGPRLLDALDEVGASGGEDPALREMIRTYSGPDSRYINFYGPSGSIPTIPYQDLLGPDAERLSARAAGKVVFVGLSERRESEQQDEFVSFFSERSGLSLSGVEIGATAFANLLAGNWIRPLPIPIQHVFLLALGFIVTLVLGRLRIRYALPAGLLLGAVYVAVAAELFESRYLWLPLLVPVGVQLPFVMAAVTLLRYRDVSLQRARVRRALGRYVPPALVDRLARDSLETPARAHELMQGTCLVSDVEQYTRLAERVEPAELADLMQAYFEALREIVEAHDGFVADAAGDSMVAIWAAAESRAGLRAQAVGAACELVAEVDRFNARRPGRELPTAIGLESGEVALGRLSGVADPMYRAVGDIVNTAARIEGLNRHLGTRVLCSASARSDVNGYDFRHVGRFLLLGKRRPTDVLELLPAVDARSGRILEQREVFEEALGRFAARDFTRAATLFERVLERVGDDGPSRFYLSRCAELANAELPPHWDGTTILEAK